MKKEYILKPVVTAFLATVLLSACNSGTASGSGALKEMAAKLGVGEASTVHFNCSATEADTCNGGGSIGLKTGGSGSKQELKLVVPAVGYGTVKLAIQDQNGQPQDKVKFGSASNDMTCDFSSSTSCKFTVDATNGIAGQNVKVVALKDDTSVASIGVTVKDGSGGGVPTNSGKFIIEYDYKKLSQMNLNDKASFIISLENSSSNDTNVDIHIGYDLNDGGASDIVSLDRNSCHFSSTEKTCEVTASSHGNYGSVALEFNNKADIVGADTHNYGSLMVLPIDVPDPAKKAVDNVNDDQIGRIATADVIYNKAKTPSFLMRGPKIKSIYSLNGPFMNDLLENIKQSDPIAFQKIVAAKMVDFSEIMLAGMDTSNDKVFYPGNTETINFHGDEIKVTVISGYQNPSPADQDKLQLTKSIIDSIYTKASTGDTNVPVIYFAHCAGGMDRTGYFVTWFLVHHYQQSDKSLNETEQYRNVILMGLAKWNYSSHTDWINMDFNKRAWQWSSLIWKLPEVLKEKEQFRSGDLNWQVEPFSNYPHGPLTEDKGADGRIMRDELPNAEEYTWTLPLCGNQYTDTSCLKFDSEKKDKVDISAGQIDGFSKYYVVYADATGKTINIDDNHGILYSDAKSIPVNQLKDSVAKVKIYAVSDDLNKYIKEKVVILR